MSPNAVARKRSSRHPAWSLPTTARRGASAGDLVSDIKQPADPQDTFAYRGAKYAVIILSALIILALIGLVAGAVIKLSGRSTKLTGGGSAQLFVLPPGAKILKSETQPGRLIMHVRSAEGDEIDIINTDDGRLISQVKTAPPSPPARQ